MKRTIGVIGSGKLGQILLKKLDDQKYDCYGTRTSESRNHVKFDINKDSFKTLPSTDIFVICIPPSKYNADKVIDFITGAHPSSVVFVSSTSVYGKSIGVVDENSQRSPITESAKKLVKIEDIILSTKTGIVVRPAGLYSEGSHPGIYLSGRTDVDNPKAPVNLISRAEVADAIIELIQQSSIRSLNIVNTHHPIKEEYYSSYCKRYGLDAPHFKTGQEHDYKIVKTIYKDFQCRSALP